MTDIIICVFSAARRSLRVPEGVARQRHQHLLNAGSHPCAYYLRMTVSLWSACQHIIVGTRASMRVCVHKNYFYVAGAVLCRFWGAFKHGRREGGTLSITSVSICSTCTCMRVIKKVIERERLVSWHCGPSRSIVSYTQHAVRFILDSD